MEIDVSLFRFRVFNRLLFLFRVTSTLILSLGCLLNRTRTATNQPDELSLPNDTLLQNLHEDGVPIPMKTVQNHQTEEDGAQLVLLLHHCKHTLSRIHFCKILNSIADNKL